MPPNYITKIIIFLINFENKSNITGKYFQLTATASITTLLLRQTFCKQKYKMAHVVYVITSKLRPELENTVNICDYEIYPLEKFMNTSKRAKIKNCIYISEKKLSVIYENNQRTW